MSSQPVVTRDGSRAPKGPATPAPISQLMGELVVDLLETTGLIPEAKFPVLREKEMLRLGDVVSREGRLTSAAMEQAIEVIGRFRTLGEACGCEELVACATKPSYALFT